MKEKTAILIMDGYQVALGVIMLVLSTVWIGFHLFAGHFNLIGFAVAALVWYIVFYLTRRKTNLCITMMIIMILTANTL